MENNSITIVFESSYSQPDILYNVKKVEIKRDNITVFGTGYTKLFFKEKIKNITADAGVKIYIR